MNKEQFAQLQSTKPTRKFILRGADLLNKAPRTLLYGYTIDSYFFHVYLDENGIIQKLVYAGATNPMLIVHETEAQIDSNESYVPNKRLYPEMCDFTFCEMLNARGVSLTFANYNEERDVSKAYHGKTLAELHQPGESLPLR